jgi:hypothetical protein
MVVLWLSILNGCHYMYQNSLFMLKDRMHLVNGVYFTVNFQLIGEQIINNFTINSENNVC